MSAMEARFPDALRFQLFTGHKGKTNIMLYQKLGYHISNTEPLTGELKLLHMTKSRDPSPS